MSDNSKPDIWQLQSHFDVQGLVKALSSDDKDIRKRAAAALRTMGAQEALDALRAAYAAEEDNNTRMVIATAIEALTDKSAPRQAEVASGAKPTAEQRKPMVERLVKRLKSNNPDDIIKAAHYLGDLGDKLAVEPLVLLFNDHTKSIQVRLAVAEALLKLESAPVEVALLANLRHADWHIRRNGAAILGQLQAEWAIQPLARALHDPHPTVRRTARSALKHIGTPESRRAIAQATSDSARRRKKTEPKTASGITVKRPGKKQQSSSGMLKKHLDPGKSDETSHKGTQRLVDPSAEGESEQSDSRQRHLNVTRPLDPEMLKELDLPDVTKKKDGDEEEDDS